jgi:nucleoside-diphosphate-sugar epimerase
MKSVLVLGITGGFGLATAQALRRSGWSLRALHRDPIRAAEVLSAKAPELPVEWIAGDALDRGAVLGASAETALLVHAVNPPGYKNWRELAVPMLENSIAAAVAGPRLVFPGNIYNFAPEDGPDLREDTPQRPHTKKGRTRIDMETRLAKASEAGTRVLIVRAGDFFGGHAPGSWFSGAMVKAGKPLTKVVYPGHTAVGHVWAYLPDLGATVARLADRAAELPDFAIFHFGGHYVEPGIDMAHSVAKAAGLPDGRIKGLPWTAIRLLSPFNRTFRELLEMRYLWRQSLRLDDSKLRAFLPDVPHTPLDRAVRDSLAALGCLD